MHGGSGKGWEMALSFKIIRHHNNSRLCLKLSGDFDGSSAAELTSILRSYGDVRQKIFIDTGSLKTLHPFGIECFKRKYRQPNGLELIWGGKYALELSSCDERLV